MDKTPDTLMSFDELMTSIKSRRPISFKRVKEGESFLDQVKSGYDGVPKKDFHTNEIKRDLKNIGRYLTKRSRFDFEATLAFMTLNHLLLQKKLSEKKKK